MLQTHKLCFPPHMPHVQNGRFYVRVTSFWDELGQIFVMCLAVCLARSLSKEMHQTDNVSLKSNYVRKCVVQDELF